eukprot:CAMPEP_0184865572 /NCGR_PEP_ID=MMETSP0580-20130426/18522_1 /TAXON_ID=1118495 /ORGANISM="Dactyliosolen fragilissimus" /LENGTH=162 /DNA_ID=CAMNT_0027364837 /DNA_START=395 /DNA_END=883 /DNA_ORIENTATION=+
MSIQRCFQDEVNAMKKIDHITGVNSITCSSTGMGMNNNRDDFKNDVNSALERRKMNNEVEVKNSAMGSMEQQLTMINGEDNSAIIDGFSALAICPESRPSHADFFSDHFFTFEEEEDEEDQIYIYSDTFSNGNNFNQSPLPLVIGSKAFIESKYAGLAYPKS